MGTALVVFGLVLGLNWSTFTIFIENRESLSEGSEWISKTHSLRGLSEYIGENPERNSFSRIVFDNPDLELHFNPDERRTLGVLSNLFLFIAFSSAMQDGIFSGGELISWEDVSRYQLSGVDESSHKEAYRQAGRRGWIENGQIELSNALLLLSEFNNLALSDYLWWMISPELWEQLPGQLNLNSTDMPLPFSGLYLSLSPTVQQTTASELQQLYDSFTDKEWRNHVAETSENFASDKNVRNQINHLLDQERIGLTFMQERDMLRFFPKGTSGELSSLIFSALRGDPDLNFSSMSLTDWMRWPVKGTSILRRDASDYGAFYDNRIGLLAGINFGTSSYTGETSVQVLLMDNLPIGFWFHASGGHMQQDLLQRLVYDPAMIGQMEFVIRQNQN